MIKELYYEWVLLCVNTFGGEVKSGFFDNKKIYEKKGWLNWKVYPIKKSESFVLELETKKNE